MTRLLLTLCLFSSFLTLAQPPGRPTASEILADIQKLQVLGSALYMAAHPDDENTRLIAHFSNVDKVETAYLSLTRGDGGQNLIAPDIRELLGLTRTQELLAARRIDGGTQFFSRANDFGYSKHPDETFNIWDKDDVLADAVWVIRKWRPDVIVLRFDPRAPGTTHGHHTASAMIGMEAFELAGDPKAYPEQLESVRPWQPRRIYWNAYTWRGVPEHMQQDKIIKVDMGTYLPLRGESVGEIAARSRSQHSSQGFGSAGRRGSYDEQLELLAGDDNDDGGPFDNMVMNWGRLEGGAPIGTLLRSIEENFDVSDPAKSIPGLIRAADMMGNLRKDDPSDFDYDESEWITKKIKATYHTIADCAGLYISATVDDPLATPGDSIEIDIEVTNRSRAEVSMNSFRIHQLDKLEYTERDLAQFQPFDETYKVKIPENSPISNPYWLNDPWKLGMYTVKNQQLRGQGESRDALTVGFNLVVNGRKINLNYPVRHRFTSPSKGEQFQPFEILPPVFTELGESSYLFAGTEPKTMKVKVTANRDNLNGTVELCGPSGWEVEPKKINLKMERDGEEQFFNFSVTPPGGQAQEMFVPMVKLEGSEEGHTRKLIRIEHPHIPTQIAALDASTPVAKVDLKTGSKNIGYLPGAGDAIPEALRNVGYNVTILEDGDITGNQLEGYDAIVIGIRAYNVLNRMPIYQPILMEYVKEGGTVVAQYNTTRGLKVDQTEIGPYPFQLSRDRTTVEEAEVRILSETHPVLMYPNRITSADFDGWVQERGLYFPSSWADEWTPILSSNDPGEEPHDGGLLVAEYGEGYFVYTGYSFFRELPAGVPGAYRLFANLIALGNVQP